MAPRPAGPGLALCGWHDGAVQAFGDALRAQPRRPGTRFRLAESQARLGRWVAAAESYRAALALRPGDVEAQGNLVIALGRSGAWEQAETALKRLIDLQPREAELHVLLGAMLRRRGQTLEAIRSFRFALTLPPCPRECALGVGVLGPDGWQDVMQSYRSAVAAEGGDSGSVRGTRLHQHPEPSHPARRR